MHKHPNYFESFIINGGYSHKLYEFGNQKNDKYDMYKIIKEGDKKTFIYLGEMPLKLIENQKVLKDSIVCYPEDLIHKVTYSEPKTLSLNAVLKNKDISYILTAKNEVLNDGLLEEVKTSRDIINNKLSKDFIEQIMELLKKN